MQVQGGMQPRITNPEGGAREGQTIAFEGGQQKSLSPSESQGVIFAKIRITNWQLKSINLFKGKTRKRQELKLSQFDI